MNYALTLRLLMPSRHLVMVMLAMLVSTGCGIMTPIESPTCDDLPQTCTCPDGDMGQTTCDEDTLTITGCDCEIADSDT